MDQNYTGTDRPTITKKDVPPVFTTLGMLGLLAWCISSTVVASILGLVRPTATDIVIALALGIVLGLINAPVFVDYAVWLASLKSRVGQSGNLTFKEGTPKRFQITMIASVMGGIALTFGILYAISQFSPELAKPSRELSNILAKDPKLGREPLLALYIHAIVVSTLVVDLGLIVVASRVIRWYNELPD